MLFEYEFDDHRYLVNLEHFDEDMGKKGMEIFRIHYSDQPEDWQEYEIKMFRVDGENLNSIKVTSLPKPFLDMMGEDLEKVMPKTS